MLRFQDGKPTPGRAVRQCPLVLDVRDGLPTNADYSGQSKLRHVGMPTQSREAGGNFSFIVWSHDLSSIFWHYNPCR